MLVSLRVLFFNKDVITRMKIVFAALRLVSGPNAEENARSPTGAGTGDEPRGRLPRQMNAY